MFNTILSRTQQRFIHEACAIIKNKSCFLKIELNLNNTQRPITEEDEADSPIVESKGSLHPGGSLLIISHIPHSIAFMAKELLG